MNCNKMISPIAAKNKSMKKTKQEACMVEQPKIPVCLQIDDHSLQDPRTTVDFKIFFSYTLNSGTMNTMLNLLAEY